jgi:hypothetical protein
MFNRGDTLLLNWSVFEQLSGSPQYNFEILCRGLIRRHYGRYGRFAARANQPGVEFHLKLHTTCDLGNPGDWFGWQCRWYDLQAGKNLGSGRRKKIEEAIAITEKELPELSDWVLWTRRPLTKGDQEWFNGLQTHMRLHLWTEAEVETHLSGGAEILRGTCFGELILNPDNLSNLHEMAVASIRRRWLPEVHQTIDAERVLRRMLGESGSWDDLQRFAGLLKADAEAIECDISQITCPLADATTEMASFARIFATALAEAHTILESGDLDLLRQQLANRPVMPDRKLGNLPRQLRACRQRAALSATNALADIRSAHSLLDEVDNYLGKRIFAVVADVGCGKTQLAAQLTAAIKDRPAGILLHGRDLHAGNNLNDLARHITIQGMPTPIPSMEALLAAVDAAGQRAHRRMPIVIDALNEAEDPRNWQGQLASMHEQLRQYPYVLVACTLRPAFTDEALPLSIDRIEIPDFGHDTYEAIRRYFRYYRINPADAELPIGLLSHPLTLRLFCEVTNPTREQEVGVAPASWSLTSLFERYLKHSAEHIAELAPRTHRYYEQDVRNALGEIGTALWEQRTRSIGERELRQRLGDETRPWNESIIRSLEQEGVVLRVPGEPPGAMRVTAIYDALAGHLVADTILSRLGSSGLEQWVRDPATITALAGQSSDSHPLAMDIFRELVGLVPRRLHGLQLWPLLNEPLRTKALLQAANLEGSYIDSQTVEELSKIAVEPPDMSPDLFDRLWHTRGAPDHPLNSEFLDAILRPMAIANRDLRWTEWLRRNSEELESDLQRLEKSWRDRMDRFLTDRLRARWVMWTLTSTVRILRDQATRTLYWFGRGDPSALFDLAIESLPINDPYVPERMLAASYGTTMALHAITANQDFRDKILPNFASKLYQLMFAKKALHSTTHALMRDFAHHTIQIALLYSPKLLTPNQCKRIVPPFHDGGIRKWGQHKGFEQNRKFSPGGPLRMDFANYTLGRLLPSRGNYNFENREYQDIVMNIYWRLNRLGYSPAIFEGIDKLISSHRYGGRSAGNANRVDRYGKKYSWIAFYELYGLRHDKGLLRSRFSDCAERPSDVDIDPSFPDEPRNLQVINEDWLGNRNESLPSWIEHGGRPDIIQYLILDEVDGVQGPWILLNGSISQVDKQHHRSLFAFPHGLFVPEQHSQELHQLLEKQKLDWDNLPEIPQDYYTFAGEIPWCETFPENGFKNANLVIGHQIEEVPHSEIRFYRKGKKLNKEETRDLLLKLPFIKNDETHQALLKLLKDEKVTFREIKTCSKKKEAVYRKIPVLLPVRRNSWESYHSGVNPGQQAIVPTREIADAFRLSLLLPSWDMCDVEGKLASVSIKWGDPWGTGHNLCYLRRDIIDLFLGEKSLDLVWAFWGAREIRLDYEDILYQAKTFKHTRKKFQRIYRYKDGHVIAGKGAEHYYK